MMDTGDAAAIPNPLLGASAPSFPDTTPSSASAGRYPTDCGLENGAPPGYAAGDP